MTHEIDVGGTKFEIPAKGSRYIGRQHPSQLQVNL